MKINERIKKLRLEHNLTQEDLAKICLVTRNAVSKWETDKGYPNLDSMILMCKYFNITLDDLISDDDTEEGLSKELAITALEDNKKLKSKFSILLIAIFSLAYLLFGVGLRELIFAYTPDAPMGYYLLFGPITYMVLGCAAGFVLKKFRYVLASAWFGFIISFVIDCIIPTYASIEFNFIFVILYLILSIVVLFIKEGKMFVFTKKIQINLVIESKLNLILSCIVFGITLISFIVCLGVSIHNEIHNIDQMVLFDAFNTVPLFWICFFITPLILEIIWIIISIKKLKGEKSEK